MSEEKLEYCSKARVTELFGSLQSVRSSEKWAARWLEMAQNVAGWSKDPSTKVGAVIFRPDNTPISFGYNGLARDVFDSVERLQNRKVKYKLTVHAEANAIINALRSGASVEGATIAVTTVPCPNCAALIINSGIKTVIFNNPTEDYKSRWDCELPLEILREAGISIITI